MFDGVTMHMDAVRGRGSTKGHHTFLWFSNRGTGVRNFVVGKVDTAMRMCLGSGCLVLLFRETHVYTKVNVITRTISCMLICEGQVSIASIRLS